MAFFIFFQLKTVYGGDSGDYLSAAAVWGVPHPPGYPLFTFFASLIYRFIPFGTPAWRVAFLSSVPAAFSIYFFYKTLRLFFNSFVSLTASLTLSFLYPVWLHSETVEVFALNSLFITALSYLTFKFCLSGEKKHRNLFFLTLGLSLAHHQTIIFLFPGLFLVWRRYWRKKINFKNLLLVLPGLIFYLYLPLASSRNPAINWGGPSTLIRFLQVFFRTGFGTFQANQMIDNTLGGRIISLLIFGRYVLLDFNLTAVILILLGLFYYLVAKKRLGSKEKIFFKYALIGFLAYTFFLFYASFNLRADFLVATWERFLIPTYIFLSFGLAFGLRLVFNEKKKIIQFLLGCVLFVLLPVNILAKNLPKIWILKDDFTAENFSLDILNSLPKDSVVFLASDSSWFNTAYVYYSLGVRREDVKFLNWYSISFDYYRQYLKKEYPDLNLIQTKEPKENLKYLVDHNSQVFMIPNLKVEGYKAVPFGLLFRYYKEDQAPPIDEVIAQNQQLWRRMSDPLSGSLKVYKNLFLADVLKYYQGSSKFLAEYLLENKAYAEAEEYLQKSLSYGAKDPEISLLQGRVYLATKRCQQAEEEFLKVKERLPDNPFPDAYLYQVYSQCFNDEQKASQFLNSCFQKESKQEVQLDEL